ncbi:Speckle-type POZ protein B [Araneus ventricosus]|uniref:Speckle-type POZ protein B n=1 Tax=Araneus ventricosus TaxID=182803 RepID=A0A4Y2LKQ0_ARAVE|nr:Speckle-type POZ protein B [Araneus ventricosus]
MYPRGRHSYENYVSVYLERLPSSGGPLGITIHYEIALLRANARERILGAEKSTLLPEDVLTVQCCIYPKDTELETSTEVIAKTHTEIERFFRPWRSIDYTRGNYISLRSEGYPRRKSLSLSVSRKSNNQFDVLSCKFHDATDLTAFHCKIGILDSNNSVVKCLVNQFFDIESATGGSKCYLYFPLITVPELQKNKSLYLPNGKLNLDCELTFCYGLQHSQIERITRDATLMSAPVDETASTAQIDLPPKKFLYCIENIPSSLKNDFQNLLQEGTLSDFILKVGDKSLQVHKAVLCARSPVFKAMLTSNMEEKAKNMMDISDLEEDTVRRMLTFMYTDMAGNVDWDTAKKLYFAGDKYCLLTLKRICSEVLNQNLSISNVGEVLVLADMHADEYLKKKALEFICDHELEVMCSTEWKTFMADEMQLASETMHDVFLKKAENRHLSSFVSTIFVKL